MLRYTETMDEVYRNLFDMSGRQMDGLTAGELADPIGYRIGNSNLSKEQWQLNRSPENYGDGDSIRLGMPDEIDQYHIQRNKLIDY